MRKIKEIKDHPYSIKKTASYRIGQIINNATYQTFSLLIFTFYFTIIGISVIFITIGLTIWSIWNSINDPLLGSLSDKVHTKWGREYLYNLFIDTPSTVKS